MKAKVITIGGGSKSIHLFETYKEACNFAEWLLQYNADLKLTVDYIDDENDNVSECSTFI